MPPLQPPRVPPQNAWNWRAYVPPAVPATWATLLVGLIVGLALGLFIGWQALPVQWTDAWPGDLSREARAQYLAAVAEAYVYYGTDEAAEIARNRLFDLNTNLEAEIADAVDFFAATRPRNFNATIANLGLLAQRLGVPVPVADAAPASPVGDTVRAWVNWTLTVVAALVLAGGGLYLVNLMQRRRSGNQDRLDDDPGGFEDEEPARTPRPAPARNPFMRPGAATAVRAASTGLPPGAPMREQTERDDDYGFVDDAPGDPTYRPGRPIATVSDYSVRDVEYHDVEYHDVEYHDDAPYQEPHYTSQGEGNDVPGRFMSSFRNDDEDTDPFASVDPSDLDDPFQDPQEDRTDYREEQPFPAAAPATGFTPRGTAAKSSRVLQTFTATYRAGYSEGSRTYIQINNIVDPESGRTVGECGMAVHSVNGILDNDPDAVIAMEVWLMDKMSESDLLSQDRVLLSEYAYDRGLESKITRDRTTDPRPIIPQAGRTPFDIKGPSLTLHCDVVEAVYAKSGARKGIFESLVIEMTVYARA